jgi:hypothetical protein
VLVEGRHALRRPEQAIKPEAGRDNTAARELADGEDLAIEGQFLLAAASLEDAFDRGVERDLDARNGW